MAQVLQDSRTDTEIVWPLKPVPFEIEMSYYDILTKLDDAVLIRCFVEADLPEYPSEVTPDL